MAEKSMTVADIDKEIARLESLKREAKWKEEQELAEANHKRAVDLTGELIEVLRVLEELGYMPPRLKEALSDSSGKFNPGMYVKKPKAPKPFATAV